MGIPEAHQRQLDETGFVIIPDVLTQPEIDAYKARLLELAELERQDGSARIHSDGDGQLVRWLVNKGEMFERMLAHPKVDPYFTYLLGDDYTLSTLTSNIISPGAKDGDYHRDHAAGRQQGVLPFPLVANTLWPLEDFIPENGGTRLVPGSHTFPEGPEPGLESHPDEIRVEAPRGSVLLFNGMVWHSAGANRTDTARIALICFCCRSFLKPMFDFVRHLEPEVLARATPEKRRLYGFDSQPGPPDRPTKQSARPITQRGS